MVVHGFLWEPSGTILSFDAPGSISTQALRINAVEMITGFYADANNRTHGFLRWPTGGIVSFDPRESTATMPTDINTAGAITGTYTLANGRILGFVRRPDGKIVSFDAPGNLGTLSLVTYSLASNPANVCNASFVLRSRPSGALVASTLIIVGLAVALPYTPLAGRFGFVPLPASYMEFVAAPVAVYLLLVELVKRLFVRSKIIRAYAPSRRQS